MDRDAARFLVRCALALGVPTLVILALNATGDWYTHDFPLFGRPLVYPAVAAWLWFRPEHKVSRQVAVFLLATVGLEFAALVQFWFDDAGTLAELQRDFGQPNMWFALFVYSHHEGFILSRNGVVIDRWSARGIPTMVVWAVCLAALIVRTRRRDVERFATAEDAADEKPDNK